MILFLSCTWKDCAVAYGVVRTDMNIRTRRDVKKFLKGFLAKLQDYEPVDFWGEEESNTNV